MSPRRPRKEQNALRCPRKAKLDTSWQAHRGHDMSGSPSATLSLSALPPEVLDHLVRHLARQHPPLALGRLGQASHLMRSCCVDRADNCWQALLQHSFGGWLPTSTPPPLIGQGPPIVYQNAARNRRAHASYCARMSCRVRVRRAAKALCSERGEFSGVQSGLQDAQVTHAGAAPNIRALCSGFDMHSAA